VVEIIPNVHENSITPHPISGRDGLIFIGNYLHTPNEDAMVYFADQILPLMRQRIPSMTLTMLGACMTERVRRIAAPCIRAVGYVSDAVPYFQKARVFVAPLRYGAGMKGKIGHSMSLGLPVVTTTIGAEGLGLVNGENALIADEPEDFSEAVIALCENDALWQRLSANGRAHIQENFSEAAVRNALRGIFLAPA
jgi:glycosyltransferase involved in cell wall biosynthesis